jgi:hypothetical protein
MEVAVLVLVVTAKEILEKSVGFFLKDGGVVGPITIWELKLMNSISFPSDNSLGMEKGAIFVPKFHPVLP